MEKANWWESRWFLLLLILGSSAPLLWPETPPLVDVPGHLGRYRIQLDLGHSENLQRYFEFHWALVGNLGVDLLVQLLAPLIGLESAVKAIILMIPPLTVVGLVWTAKEVHGRVPPTVLFAVPLVYSFPFNYGFLNYALSLALALIAFGYWMRLTRLDRLRFRAIAFAFISSAIWVVHAFGWGLLGLMAISSEIVRLRELDRSWVKSAVGAASNTVPMAFPLVAMVFGAGSVVGGPTSGFFALEKFLSLISILRDRWLIWDSLGVAAVLLLLGSAALDPRFQISKRLLMCTGILFAIFLLMPGRILGLTFADMRIAPVAMIMAVLALRVEPAHDRVARMIAIAGAAFVLLRLAGNTASFLIVDRERRTWLTALDHVPTGAAVLSLVGGDCYDHWQLDRHSHMGSFVIVRKYGFSNDQWQASGAQLLRVRYLAAAPFTEDRSSYVFSRQCFEKWHRLGAREDAHNSRLPEVALAQFPRRAFDYVWMIKPGEFKMYDRPGLTIIWRSNDSALYRVDRHNK